jgi:nicotinate dehydrogenase subunit A
MAGSVSVVLNGQSSSLTYNDTSEFLLYLLRAQFELNGPRFGCGISECGCCTVLLNGAAVRSCVTEVGTLHSGDEIITLEGIGTPDEPHPLQQAFIDEQAGGNAICASRATQRTQRHVCRVGVGVLDRARLPGDRRHLPDRQFRLRPVQR